MRKINILDPLTANQIAAGEVVERPVSVVKELIENSIDAGSTRIKVYLEEGGTKRIQITDNGWGIEAQDLPTAVQRHATSKIISFDDLNSLSTLGFRGEALPSIAAVSKMTLSSRTEESPVGFSLQVEGDQISDLREIGSPVGTEIIVDNLFYNTPARKKFLKSPSNELGMVSEMVGRIAISRPDIAFELVHERRTLLKTPGNHNLSQVIFSVYGNEITRSLTKVEYKHGPLIRGYISNVQTTRSTRQYYNFYLNGRFIKSKDLSEALEEAYHTRIPQKRYPIAILFFEMAPELFDANVHPAKLEVKFKDFQPIKEALIHAIHNALNDPSVSIPQIKTNVKQDNKPAEQQEIFQKYSFDPEKMKQPPGEVVLEQTGSYHDQAGNEQHKASFSDQEEPHISERQAESQEIKPFFSSLKILGQIEGTYIIASGDEGLYIIDQHAAHERIRFEKIKKLFAEQPSASNMLAVPITIELTPRQTIWLINHIIQLGDLGFVLEHFGDRTFLLRGVPVWHIEGNSQELLLDILEKLGSDSPVRLKEIINEEKLFSLACKSAVKGNSFITSADITFLLEQLNRTDNPFTCPHGRPTLILLTHEEIKRRFLRT
ncbi:DNA mismatch repair endonuclease MutL [Dehalobacterium formicoaceticum]|uniref:DNA mismatch repair protein MutL n=1 Tax=Dehalobacterium formicoaceticum TaxID=51515 RepID=A0ABT1Y4Z7_9FIRM|nr:DNA mismatch repair endonuclease MutL [Dehalobacterium formicoaceticum]MCR6545939.1 DNA mismatch repair endonuclease MutL [Dehalobacterium formicoaceticum]